MATPVSILQRIMPYREFREWAIWAERYPFGDEAQQLLLARFYADWINSKLRRGAKKVKPTDVLPFYRKPTASKRPVTMDDKFKRMLGGFDPAEARKARRGRKR